MRRHVDRFLNSPLRCCFAPALPPTFLIAGTRGEWVTATCSIVFTVSGWKRCKMSIELNGYRLRYCLGIASPRTQYNWSHFDGKFDGDVCEAKSVQFYVCTAMRSVKCKPTVVLWWVWSVCLLRPCLSVMKLRSCAFLGKVISCLCRDTYVFETNCLVDRNMISSSELYFKLFLRFGYLARGIPAAAAKLRWP